jgi:hypothetical protein
MTAFIAFLMLLILAMTPKAFAGSVSVNESIVITSSGAGSVPSSPSGLGGATSP